MLRTTLAGLRFHKTRLALSSLAILLGVAFVAGTLVMGASMTQAFYNNFAAGARNVDAAVAPATTGKNALRPGSPTAPSVPASVLAEVGGVPGVAAAAGRVVGQAPLFGANGKVIVNGDLGGIGISVGSDPALRGFTVASGRLPAAPGEAVVDTATAADEHFRLGQAIRVVDSSGAAVSFRLAGTIDLGVNHEFGNSTVTGFETAAAFQVTGRPGYDQVVTRAAPGVSQATLVTRIKAVPGFSAYQVQTGSQLATSEANSAVHFANQFTTVILVFALIALAVASIVIYNTFTILTAQRGRELALLRCVGASRRQVFLGTLAESLVVGAVASAAGVVAGVGLGWGLQRLFTAFGAAIPSGPLVLKPSTVAISMVVGMAVTFFAAVLPARSATKVAPVAALGGQVEPKVTKKVGWLRLAVGAVFGGGGVLLAYAGTQHVNGSGGFVEIAAGGCVCFVAVLALGPLIAPPVTALFGWLPGRLFGVPARLASANARRNPHRVAATTAALTIGMTLMTVFTVVISSAEASASATIDQHYPFDYVVQASGAGRTVPPQVISALRASPQLGVVAPHYTQHAAVNGVRNDIGAFGRGALGVSVRPQMISGSLDAIGQGTAAVDTSQVGKHGISASGSIVLDTPDAGPQTLRIVAVYNGANGPLPNVLISEPDFLQGFQPSGADEVFINAAPGVSVAASRAAVNQATASDPLIRVNTIADYKSNLASRVNQVLALFGTLLGLAILIALFGIANTLSLSVIERTRESALLRAMGLTRGQLRQMLLTEAGLMALLGMALGVGLGAAFGWAMVNAFIKSSGGQGVLSIPYGQIAIYVVIGGCAGLLAAVLPARRAAKISVVAAMAEA